MKKIRKQNCDSQTCFTVLQSPLEMPGLIVFGIWDENGTFKWLLQNAVKLIASLEALQLLLLRLLYDLHLIGIGPCA